LSLFALLPRRGQPVEKLPWRRFSPQIRHQTRRFWGIWCPICGRYEPNTDFFNRLGCSRKFGLRAPEFIADSSLGVSFHTRDSARHPMTRHLVLSSRRVPRGQPSREALGAHPPSGPSSRKLARKFRRNGHLADVWSLLACYQERERVRGTLREGSRSLSLWLPPLADAGPHP
jgi:hypothetical protein